MKVRVVFRGEWSSGVRGGDLSPGVPDLLLLVHSPDTNPKPGPRASPRHPHDCQATPSDTKTGTRASLRHPTWEAGNLR